MFSEPEALEKLSALKNITLKMFRTTGETGGFHTKGYIFRKEEMYRIIIGSSNMTLSAITKNKEWNTKIVSTEQGEMAQHILVEFDELWESSQSEDYVDFIEDYRQKYHENKLIQKQKKQAAQDKVVEFERYTLKPNKMQTAFVENVMRLRKKGIDRALLLSSTGQEKHWLPLLPCVKCSQNGHYFLCTENRLRNSLLKAINVCWKLQKIRTSIRNLERNECRIFFLQPCR